jgi:hypothetical protein
LQLHDGARKTIEEKLAWNDGIGNEEEVITKA